MDGKYGSRRNTVQNLLIALLLCSALFLLFQLQRVSRSGGYLSLLSDSAAPSVVTDQVSALPTLPAPVRLAVTGAYGRYGNLGLTTTDEAFSAPGSLLREALGSAEAPQACQEADFRAALTAESVYYDFESTLPLDLLAGLVGADAPADRSARRLLLALEGDAVALYLTDGDAFSRCATKVVPEDLTELIGGYQLGGAAFAFELEADTLAPYALFLTEETPSYPALNAITVSGDSDETLAVFGFTPRIKSRYTDPDGTLVIVEGDRVLRLQPDGAIVYENSGDPDLVVTAAGEQPTAREAALGVFQLLGQLPAGEAALYLCDIRAGGSNDWTLTFDYQINGIPIRRSSGTPAATVQLKGSGIVRITVYPRQYTSADSASLLLPLPQALAIARVHTGKELAICYTDTGAASLSASWLAE